MRRLFAGLSIILVFALPAVADDISSSEKLLTDPPANASGAPKSVIPVDPALPRVPTQLNVRAGRSGKPTAGDLVELVLKPSQAEATDTEIALAKELKSGPVEWGDGRILWIKPFDQASGTIVIGLTTYKPGKFEIKPIPFVKNGAQVFASETQSVDFSSVGGDKSKDDIYPPQGVSMPMWFWILLGLLVLALVLGALYWLQKWHAKRKATIEALARAPRILNPAEEFERSRADTEQKGFVERGNFKPHYFSFSDASKRFLGRAYRFDAEERTTRELVRELENLGMLDQLVDEWEKIFDEMDVVKFTDQLPESSSAKSLGERLARMVSNSYAGSPVAREEAMKRMAEQKKVAGK